MLTSRLVRTRAGAKTWLGLLCIVTVATVFSITMLSRAGLQQLQPLDERLFINVTLERQLCEQSFDAVLVLGGGQPRQYLPPLWTRRRCDLAARYYHCRATRNASRPHIIALSAGSAHAKMLLDKDGFPIFESTASAHYLHSHGGVEPLDIVVESTSYDTIGNAFWARVAHTDVRGWRKLLVVTSDYHMPRSRFIFDWVYGLKPVDAANPYNIQYAAVSDDTIGMVVEVLAARQRKEAASLNSTRQTASDIRSLSELHSWLSTRHDLYAPARFLTKQRELITDNALKASYGGA